MGSGAETVNLALESRDQLLKALLDGRINANKVAKKICRQLNK